MRRVLAVLGAVGMVAAVPSLVVTGPGFPGKTLRDLLAQAKANPGKLEYASSGTGSTSHAEAPLPRTPLMFTVTIG